LPLIAAAGLVRYSRIVFLSDVNDCSAICLETKEPKIQGNREGFLSHIAQTANQVKPGLESLRHYATALPGKNSYALPPHRPALFSLISSEAFLLPEKMKRKLLSHESF
jgi:hypothetical protein